MKICTNCGKKRSEEKFVIRKSGRGKGTIAQPCKPCRARRARTDLEREQQNERDRERHRKKREEFYDHYGRICACCGETEPSFLTADHKNNDGYIHRKVIGVRGRSIYEWTIKNGFPDTIQVLCYNCNLGRARKRDGVFVCPHMENPPPTSKTVKGGSPRVVRIKRGGQKDRESRANGQTLRG